jgi:hypothetical protein
MASLKNGEDINRKTKAKARFTEYARLTVRLFFEEFFTLYANRVLDDKQFKDLDFPGTGRVTELCRILYALDFANWRVVIDGGSEYQDWKQGRPKVYERLEGWMKRVRGEEGARNFRDDVFAEQEIEEFISGKVYSTTYSATD